MPSHTPEPTRCHRHLPVGQHIHCERVRTENEKNKKHEKRHARRTTDDRPGAPTSPRARRGPRATRQIFTSPETSPPICDGFAKPPQTMGTVPVRPVRHTAGAHKAKISHTPRADPTGHSTTPRASPQARSDECRAA